MSITTPVPFETSVIGSLPRPQWVRDMVGQDPRETSNYDLVLSTEMLSVEKAAKVVVTAFEP